MLPEKPYNIYIQNRTGKIRHEKVTVVRKQDVCCFTEYAAGLMDLIFEKVVVDPAPYTAVLKEIPVPEDLCAEFPRPDREEVIDRFVSRFNRGLVA